MPLVGTWIEIPQPGKSGKVVKSCPSWARGLKFRLGRHYLLPASCPSWARGLKFTRTSGIADVQVVPLVGTWIEIEIVMLISTGLRSCPSWARGLKSREAAGQLLSVVVPLVGTWIEIPKKRGGIPALGRAPRGHVD